MPQTDNTAQITPPNTPAPGTPEYDAAMVARADANNVRVRVSNATSGTSMDIEDDGGDKSDAQSSSDNKTDDAKPQRPDWCPEKFWNAEKGEVNVEALAKSYGELERARSKPDLAKPGAKPAPTAKPEDGQKPEGDQQQGGETVTLADALKLADEDYASNGELTDKSYEALEKAGIPRQYADAYVAGLRAQAEVVTLRVHMEAGGEEELAKMTEWAKTNWSAEQIEAYNAAVTSGDLSATLGAVRNLKALYLAAQGVDPETRVAPKGGASNTAPVEMFRSKEEVVQAMSDPRYLRGDRAYHAEVDRKLEAALRAGIDLGF